MPLSSHTSWAFSNETVKSYEKPAENPELIRAISLQALDAAQITNQFESAATAQAPLDKSEMNNQLGEQLAAFSEELNALQDMLAHGEVSPDSAVTAMQNAKDLSHKVALAFETLPELTSEQELTNNRAQSAALALELASNDLALGDTESAQASLNSAKKYLSKIGS